MRSLVRPQQEGLLHRERRIRQDIVRGPQPTSPSDYLENTSEDRGDEQEPHVVSYRLHEVHN